MAQKVTAMDSRMATALPVTIVRLRHHEPTRAYVERRTNEGLTKREIIRCLKRYIAREIYANLPRTQDDSFTKDTWPDAA